MKRFATTIEIYEKGCGDIDRSVRYSVSQEFQDAGVATSDFQLFRRTVRVTNPSDETRTIQIAVCAETDFQPTNWVITGVIYGDNAAGRGVASDAAMQNAECRMQNGGAMPGSAGFQPAEKPGSAGFQPAALSQARCLCPQGSGQPPSPCGVWFDATGVEPHTLRTRYADTVRRYADCGVDITREPMLVAPAPHTSLGGVVIDTKCRVLRPDGSPIPGLYAAGEVTGGVHGLNRISGNAGTEVLVFGRIAGTEAARLALAA